MPLLPDGAHAEPRLQTRHVCVLPCCRPQPRPSPPSARSASCWCLRSAPTSASLCRWAAVQARPADQTTALRRLLLSQQHAWQPVAATPCRPVRRADACGTHACKQAGAASIPAAAHALKVCACSPLILLQHFHPRCVPRMHCYALLLPPRCRAPQAHLTPLPWPPRTPAQQAVPLHPQQQPLRLQQKSPSQPQQTPSPLQHPPLQRPSPRPLLLQGLQTAPRPQPALLVRQPLLVGQAKAGHAFGAAVQQAQSTLHRLSLSLDYQPLSTSWWQHYAQSTVSSTLFSHRTSPPQSSVCCWQLVTCCMWHRCPC